MTPCLEDLIEIEHGQDLSVEVADGYVIPCNTVGKVVIRQLDDCGRLLTARIERVLYVPGLRRRLFSVPTFATNGHGVLFHDSCVTLLFENYSNPTFAVTMHSNG
ncbi:MAG: hypothetical protein ACRDL7_14865, partial [Gaiellaceae bacterium]